MTWWCITLTEPWSWTPRAYPGIWASVLLLVVPYLVAMRRRTGPNPHAGRRTAFFLAGAAIYWVATDWPVGTLGAGYLASVHMLQFLLYTLGAAPLLLLGIPEWMARKVLGRLRAYRVMGFVTKPIIAGVIFNGMLLLTHAPFTVDALRSSQMGSLALDAAWLAGGLLLWMPLVSPLPELQAKGYFVKMIYLFLAGQVIPMIPGGALTFADFPLYTTYELAPRTFGLSSRHDQQMAGALMKIGGLPVIWGTMFALMFRWGKAEGHIDERERRRRAAAT